MDSSGLATLVEPPRWVRGPARLDGEEVVLDADAAEWYLPIEEAGLLWDLADVRTAADIIAFVPRYGLLEHTPADQGDFREPVSLWLDKMEHLRTLLGLWSDLRNAMEGDGECLDRLRAASAVFASAFSAPADDDAALFTQASTVLAGGISHGLRGTEFDISAAVEWGGEPGRFLYLPRPKTLLGFAYYQLAQRVVDRAELRSCLECGRVFPVHDRRQRYCSRQHADRARYRRYAHRHADDKPTRNRRSS